MDKFTDFCYSISGYIRKIYAYYNVDWEDIKQDSALIYFSTPEIEAFIDSGRIDEAKNMFLKKLRSYAIVWSPTGMQFRDNETYQRQAELMEKYANEGIDYIEVEDNILALIMKEKIVECVGNDSYDFLVYYYANGISITAKQYNTTVGYTKNRKNRLIGKLRMAFKEPEIA